MYRPWVAQVAIMGCIKILLCRREELGVNAAEDRAVEEGMGAGENARNESGAAGGLVSQLGARGSTQYLKGA